jgi:hypothetical protein
VAAVKVCFSDALVQITQFLLSGSHVNVYFRLPGASWRFLAAPGGPWRLLAAPGASWRFLASAAPGCPWRLLAAAGASWRFLALPGAFWRLLAAPGGRWRFLAPVVYYKKFVLGPPPHYGACLYFWALPLAAVTGATNKACLKCMQLRLYGEFPYRLT